MAREKLVYMVMDTETATLPFANEIAKGDAEVKKRIAISRPIVYDVGWTLMYRDGTIFERKQYLVAETFSVMPVFRTAYYAEKRPIYLEMIRNGEIEVKTWAEITAEMVADLDRADFVGAFNSMFDFKKAIPFTELYINKINSEDYFEWEAMQYKMCESIVHKNIRKNEKPFDECHFSFRGHDYELFDIWGMACEHLLNRVAYKNLCLDYGMLTNSGEFFKSSAESSYRYLCKKYDFKEAHTALADAEIESFILAKILKKCAVKVGIDYFPFRKLGTTDEFVMNHCPARAGVVYNAMYNYCGEEENPNNYQKHILDKMEILREIMEG